MGTQSEIDVRVLGRGCWVLEPPADVRSARWLVLARNGEAAVSLVSGTVTAAEGTVLILSGGAPLSVRLEGEARAIAVRLRCDTGALPKLGPVTTFEVCQGRVSGMFAHVLTGLADDAANGVEYRCERTHRLLVGFVRTLCLDEVRLEEGRAPDLFSEAADKIEDRLWDSELDAEDVARMLNVSTRTLHRAFRSQGVTLSAWIREQRLERCRDDLLDPRHRHVPISKVAARWGIPDAAHFSRLFKLRYGVSPRTYRAGDCMAGAAEGAMDLVPA